MNFSFAAINTSTTAGIYLEYGEDFSNYEKPVSNIEYTGVNNILPINSDVNTNTVTYKFPFDLSNYSRNSQVKIFEGTTSNVICSSPSDTQSQKSCIINYDTNYISSKHTLGFQICNSDGVCSSPYRYSFPFLQKDESESIQSGFYIGYNSFFNITGLTVSNPYYVSPTPENNQRNVYTQNITIKVHDGNQNLDSCQVEINNNTYPMPYDDTHCIYTYSINESNTTQTIEFQSSYTISGIESNLEKRTIYIYPDRETENKVPGFGLTSLLITLIIIFGGILK